MSLGGCYVAINTEELRDVLNNEKSLSDLVFNGGTCKTYTLEQSWDAVRIILDNFTTDAMGGENVLEGDLGECCKNAHRK